MICYLDLDGVLVDFISDFVKLGNTTLQDIVNKHELPLPFNIEQLFDIEDKSKIYDLISINFWVDLKKYAWADELLSKLEEIFKDNIYFLTSAGVPGTPFFNKATIGKGMWVQKHYPNYAEKTIFAYNKGNLGAPNKILIDDYSDNLKGFYKEGGYGVLFPQYWNLNYEFMDNNVNKVLSDIDDLLKYNINKSYLIGITQI